MDDILNSDEAQAHIPYHVEFTPQDILASIGFEAQRIAAAVGQHAAGSAFPDPKAIQQLIERMAHLNKALIKFAAVVTSGAAVANGGMTATLDS